MYVPVLHASCTHFVWSLTFHDVQLPPPPPVKVPPVPHLEMASMGWPLGSLTHKKQANVLVDGAPAVQNGHDVGYFIPHVGAPNALLPVHTAFSKHKVMFPISHLMIGKKPAGTYLGFIGGLACANPVSMPTGCVLLLKCTVLSTMTMWDIVKGVYSIVMEVLFDAAWNKIFKGAWIKTWAKGLKPVADPKKWKRLECLKRPTYLEVLLKNPKGQEVWPNMVSVIFELQTMEVIRKSLPVMFRNKAVDHVLKKSWVASPVAVGASKDEPGIGRGHGSVSVKFF